MEHLLIWGLGGSKLPTNSTQQQPGHDSPFDGPDGFIPGTRSGKTGAKDAELTSSHQDSQGIEPLGILAAMSEGEWGRGGYRKLRPGQWPQGLRTVLELSFGSWTCLLLFLECPA